MLLASRTVGGTLKYLVLSFHLTLTLGLLLLVSLWSFSPLGGQAILRVAELQTTVAIRNQSVTYYPVADIYNASFSMIQGANYYYSALASVKALVLSSLYDTSTRLIHSNSSAPEFEETVANLGGPVAAVDAAQQDLWGGVRVPFLHMLEGYNPLQPESWVEIPTDRIPPYQSLIGVTIRGMPQDVPGNTTLYLNSTYHFLQVSQDIQQGQSQPKVVILSVYPLC